MPVDARLFEFLVCPGCHGPLRALDADRGIECTSCGRVYAVRDGIPNMLLDEATPPVRPSPE